MTNAAGHLKALHEFVSVVGQARFLQSDRVLIAERPASLFISRLLRYITLLTAVITARLSSGDHYTSARPDIATERPIDPGRGAPAFIRVFMRPLFLLGRRNLVRQHAFPPAVALTSATTAICDGLPACVRYWILLSRARPIDPLIVNHFIPHFSAPTLASVSAPARTLVPEIEGTADTNLRATSRVERCGSASALRSQSEQNVTRSAPCPLHLSRLRRLSVIAVAAIGVVVVKVKHVE